MLVLAFAFTSSAWAQEPKDLVKKLSSTSYTERERSANELVKLGKTAMPALLAAVDHADLETRRRVVMVLERIEDKISIAQVVEPSRINVRVQDQSLHEALGELSHRMGLRVNTPNGRDRKISVVADALPFWQAWARIRTDAKLEEYDWTAAAAKLRRVEDVTTTIAMLDSFTVPLLRVVDTPDPYIEDNRSSVRVRVKWQALDRSLKGDDPNAILAFEVRSEPRLEMASLPRVKVTKIIDAAGKEQHCEPTPLFPPTSDPVRAMFLAAYAGEVQFNGLLHLHAIPWRGAAEPLRAVHGEVRLHVINRATLIELPKVMKAEGKEVRSFDDVRMKVLETEANDEGEIAIRLQLEGLESLAPTTDDQKIVRIRPGLVAVRGAIDVAIERLRLRDGYVLQSPLMKTEYREVAKGRYEVQAYFTARAGDDLALVLTKAPRTIAVDVPFQVTGVTPPATKRE